MRQAFGGEWTQRKLAVLEKYLKAYMTIMRRNPTASKTFRVTYLDGFAGSGIRYSPAQEDTLEVSAPWAEDFSEADVREFHKGSPRVALELDLPNLKPFDHYIFVEKNRNWVRELRSLQQEFPDRDIQIVEGDCNEYIRKWCSSLQWNDRALVFLDPYGMQVEWRTLETLAKTEKVDLWLLVPLGSAIMRLLVRRQPPPESWQKRLNDLFGTEAWLEHFYQATAVQTLFGDEEEIIRTATFDTVTQFFVQRLQGVFKGVLDQPAVLRNSKNIPLYVLCFAASNPKGAPTAVKIARDIAEGLHGS
ncbi:MAG: hypothetical protein KatS3mg023_2756 [Armatimonadota bacterium]|nr:MAG: hypothetical protein KatS3mg023_2756 [Armatimonadota bacterium]